MPERASPRRGAVTRGRGGRRRRAGPAEPPGKRDVRGCGEKSLEKRRAGRAELRVSSLSVFIREVLSSCCGSAGGAFWRRRRKAAGGRACCSPLRGRGTACGGRAAAGLVEAAVRASPAAAGGKVPERLLLSLSFPPSGGQFPSLEDVSSPRPLAAAVFPLSGLVRGAR